MALDKGMIKCNQRNKSPKGRLTEKTRYFTESQIYQNVLLFKYKKDKMIQEE